MYLALALALTVAQPVQKKDPPGSGPFAPFGKPALLGKEDTAFPDLIKLPAIPDQSKRNDQDFKSWKQEYDRYREELTGRIFKDVLPELPKDATLLQKVQYEQVRSGLTYLARIQTVIEIGRWDPTSLREYLTVASEVYRVAAELHTTPAARVRCYEARVILHKDFELFIGMRVLSGADGPQALDQARFQRLQAEVDLLKLKESLKDKK